MLPQNVGVYEPGKRAVYWLFLLMAGCATGPHRSASPVLDWRSEDSVAPGSPPKPNAVPEPGAAQDGRTVLVQTNPVVETWVPLDRWCQEIGLTAPTRVSGAPLPVYAVTTADGLLLLRMGSQLAHWAGLEVWLGFPPQLLNGQPYVHSLDLEKTLEPLAGRTPTAFLKTNRTIVIDPGHGGSDSGASSVLAGRYEKEFTLDWAQRLGRLLASRGWQVWLTRNSDVNLSLPDRVAMAEERHAALFVSLHFNSSAPDHEQAGLETYCLTPAGMPSSVSRGFTDEQALVCPNNAFDRENLQLAFRVQQALLGVNGHRDRGVRRARFPAVLRGQERPAILIEGGYLSNLQEARQIADPAYRQRLAEAVAGALGGESKVVGLKTQAQELPAPEAVQTNTSP